MSDDVVTTVEAATEAPPEDRRALRSFVSHARAIGFITLISRLLAHYWTTNEPQEVRRTIAEDWLEDLTEFPAAVVAAACREWRRTQPRRPTPADIRAICVADAQAEREHLRAIADQRAAWPHWLEELWGPAPEGPQARAEAMQRVQERLNNPPGMPEAAE